MCEAFKACFEKLEGLTNKELDRSTVDLVAVENQNVALVIAHLAEISRRKAALEHGYRSLFDYGVQRLGLSEGSVALRIQVANVSRRFPQILSALAEGRISLSVAGRLAPHLRKVETSEPATSRHVPAAVRDRVFQRAGHQCQFTGPDGTRCTARTGLEIEHTVPFAMRPEHDEPGLEILCAPHNRLRAEQAYGARYIHAKISERRLAGRVERELKTSGRRCLQVALTESPAKGSY